ncbi:MAG: NUDIX domain-containing protein [Acidimicrobiales bacterium]
MNQERIERPSARVVVVDDNWRVLLIEVVDPSNERHHWIVPGGGIEEGETLAEAAARELKEETGLILTPSELGSPIAKNSGDWEFRTTLYHSDNFYFIAQVREFEVALDGLTPEEKNVHFDWRWWTLEDLDSATVRIVPPGLADAIRRIRATGTPGEPLELPYEE